MGRMADARKRARKKAETPGSEGGASPARTTEDPPPAAPSDIPPAADPMVFADEPAEAVLPATAPEPRPARTGAPPKLEPPATEEPATSEVVARSHPAAKAAKIELPASGLAEDILARVDATLVAPAAAAAPATAEAAGSLLVPGSEPAPVAETARAHNISFFAAPARDDRVVAEATEHLTTFFLDREEYGVDVRLVQEIRRVTEVTQVPRAPDFIKGVMNLRGRIIPVVDLKLRLSLGEVVPTRASRIVVVKLADRLIGLLVDGASKVMKVPVSAIEAPPEEVVAKGGTYIRGVAKLENRLIILVDLHRILDLGARGEDAEPRSIT
jgi:purine-binding chemotaxis protein CheW